MKKRNVLDDEAVSPVIATILMVAITVVLAATLYMMLPSGGGGGEQQAGAFTGSDSIANDDWKVTFGEFNPSRGVSDLTFRFVVDNTGNTFSFDSDADGISTTVDVDGTTYQINYTDQVDDQEISQGDYLTIGAGADGSDSFTTGQYELIALYDGDEVASEDWSVTT